MRYKGAVLARGSAFISALALTAALLSGCISSAAPESIELGPGSETAVIILGASVDHNRVALKDDWNEKPVSLLTHWQQYDPNTMRLIPGGLRAMSLRDNTIWDDAAYYDPVVQVLEVEPGDYALVGAQIFKTITTFVPLKDGHFQRHTNSLFPLASEIEMEGPVDAKHNFLFSARAGQAVYIGHFNFVHVGAGMHRIVKVDYWQNAAAARAALKDYPGIKSDLVTLNLALPTEQAAR